jgi:probable HAF family extracellular repeat protein
MVDLGIIGPSGIAVAASASGVITGWITDLNAGTTQAFWWSSTTGTIDLGTLGGTSSRALAISPGGGQVVGDSDIAIGYRHGFSWTLAGGIVDLGSLDGFYSLPGGVSDTGQVVGASTYSPLDSNFQHAFSWTAGGGMVDLGTLGGDSSYAQALNNMGQAVGASTTEPGGFTPLHAMSWTAGAGMVDLGALAGGDSFADLVNERGQVVGVSFPSGTSEYRATMWMPPVNVLSAVQALLDVMEAYGLNPRFTSALSGPLRAASASWDRGDSTGAVRHIRRFVRQLDTQRGRGLTESQADGLFYSANGIIDAVNVGTAF